MMERQVPADADTKTITIGDFLSPDEILAAYRLYRANPDEFHKECLKQVIEPVMDRINRDLGQENNASYLTFCVEFAFMCNPPPE